MTRLVNKDDTMETALKKGPDLPGLRGRSKTTSGLMVAGCLVMTGAGVMLADQSSEVLVARSFSKALAALPTPAFAPTPSATSSYQLVAGSEDFWLRDAGSASLVQRASVGQKIKLSAHGLQRLLTIMRIDDADEASPVADTYRTLPAHVLVTCREESGEVIKLRFDGRTISQVPATGPAV